MIDKILALKNTNKFLYYLALAVLAIPAFGLLWITVFSPMVRAYLLASAKKIFNSAKEKDKEIAKSIDDTQKEIDKNSGKIEAIDEEIKKVSEEDGDVNWHKNFKK